MKRRICTIVGARPQLVKAAAVSAVFARLSAAREISVAEDIIHTGQHFDDRMSGSFFRDLGIPAPVVDLGINGGSHAEMTAAMLVALEREFCDRRPDLVLLYGDTNSTLAGALAAAKLTIPIAHVEAGPRMYNRAHPEEVNRVAVDHMSDLLLAPTARCMRNLADEGLAARAHQVGDVMLDMARNFQSGAPVPVVASPFVLCTVHRPQNTDHPQPLERLLALLAALGEAVLIPAHPRLTAALARHGLRWPANVQVIEPLPYLQMLACIRDARAILSDSGGLPKEAYFLGRRSLTLSSETAWPELVECGATRIVDWSCPSLAEDLEWARAPADTANNPFGDGTAGEKIARLIDRLI